MTQRSLLRAAVPLVLIATLALAVGATSAQAAGQQLPPTSYHLYFGDLHSHTSYSDGWEGTPATAFAAATAAGADFMATTDHHYALNAETWADTLQAAQDYTTPSFVAMPGYEYWMPGVGEINVFNATSFPAAVNPRARRGNPGHHALRWNALPSLYNWLAGQTGAVGQWNHPTAYTGVSSDDFFGYAFWSEYNDRGVGLIEVYNDIVYEASYVKALEAGWHVMPAANSDTHYPDWISGYDMRTVLLAPDLTPADLYAAMSAGRGYGTLDKNLRVRYTVNGEVMGSVLDGSSSTFSVWVQVEDPDADAADAITQVDIVSDNGAVVASLPASGNAVELSATLTSATASYYYARVSTASGPDGLPGPTAWTAPVWTGR